MPDESRAKRKIHLEISMAGLARVHDRFLRGCQHGLVLGDSLEADMRWIAELERILIGSGYLTKQEIHDRHLLVNVKWTPAYDKPNEVN